jgi:hypothetical protein
LVFGLWSLVVGLWELVFGCWSLAVGLWVLEIKKKNIQWERIGKRWGFMFPESRCIGMVNHTPGLTPHQSAFGRYKNFCRQVAKIKIINYIQFYEYKYPNKNIIRTTIFCNPISYLHYCEDISLQYNLGWQNTKRHCHVQI